MQTKKISTVLIITFCLGFVAPVNAATQNVNAVKFPDQEATIAAIKKVIPAVASIIIYDQVESSAINLNTGETSVKKEKAQIGSGTGFLFSSDGLILTNKHVVNMGSENAEFRVILNSGKQYAAKALGKDPINDLAVLKISDKNLPSVELGNSDELQLGSTVIAIGNTLGRYQNSATKGIVSGLGRSLIASDQSGGNSESLDNVIQTDANINLGNSGGPLIDLNGKVVGINVATDQSGSAVGFSIPVNDAKVVIQTIKQFGRIIRPRIGIRYLMLTPEVAESKGAPRNSGALIVKGDDGGFAISPGSPAEKAGIIESDVITEINGIKIQGKTTLLSVVQKFKPGNKIGLKVQRGKKVLIKQVTLDEFK